MTTDIEQTNSTTQLDKKHASGREFQEQKLKAIIKNIRADIKQKDEEQAQLDNLYCSRGFWESEAARLKFCELGQLIRVAREQCQLVTLSLYYLQNPTTNNHSHYKAKAEQKRAYRESMVASLAYKRAQSQLDRSLQNYRYGR